jgi:transcriptional regulator GlxA family with amidase domain
VTPEDLAHLRRARDLMDRDYAKPLDVPALARQALMSPSHFSRQFRAAYGETPYSYLMTRRIERAMALLRRGDLSVTDVCMEVGCTSPERLPGPVPRRHRGDPSVRGQDLDQTEQDQRSAGQPACVTSETWKSRSLTASLPSTTRTRH